ncbi:MAG TPA: CBS domain-containing protein [Candidatus Saccharimonadales bacterium]|nr:CBS domain-containing protein [Candidatus Saccharimonadales bacterium]
MKVKDIMYTRLFSIPFDATVDRAARIMDENNVGALLVEKEDKRIGIVTEWDIVRRVTAAGRNPEDITVDEIKSYPLIIIDSDFDILEAAQLMQRHDIRRLMVVEKGKIVGIISTNIICNNIPALLKETT